MSRNNDRNEGMDEGRGFQDIPRWVYWAVAGVIVAVLAFSIFKLVRWNMGTAETEGVVEGDFEVEVLDQIFLMPPDKKALGVDDGKETILFLGNDVLTYYSDENGFVQQVEKKLGATCINAGFPGSTVALKNATYDPEYAMDAFSFYNVANSIVNQDFSRMLQASTSFGDSRFDENSALLKSVDMSTVDTLVIFYDAQDYINLRIGMNPDNDSDPITYSGALNAGIKAIQEKYPYIRIVCMSFPMCYAYDATGALVSGDRFDFGNGRLTTYLQFMIDTCGATGVSFVDNYYGTIHEDNSSGWMLDNIHVNAACNEHMAQHFIEAIYPNGLNAEE
ncbi:SGNH/GDSL hydrolase family protein [Butyrivibrio sp. AE2032]|uniref:SGNH/GDSL hydrolase family protein n=1 Tax=Butyrivibrio sp. AE2032 TaxID=1458463 RepID=UPI00055584F3|nr:hypothetical protein [Butyrivibrio sp. AE2032]